MKQQIEFQLPVQIAAADPASETTVFEAQICSHVYRLYGPTDEEMAIVEGNDGSDAETQRKDFPHPASPRKREKSVAEEPMDDAVLE